MITILIGELCKPRLLRCTRYLCVLVLLSQTEIPREFRMPNLHTGFRYPPITLLCCLPYHTINSSNGFVYLTAMWRRMSSQFDCVGRTRSYPYCYWFAVSRLAIGQQRRSKLTLCVSKYITVVPYWVGKRNGVILVSLCDCSGLVTLWLLAIYIYDYSVFWLYLRLRCRFCIIVVLYLWFFGFGLIFNEVVFGYFVIVALCCYVVCGWRIFI